MKGIAAFESSDGCAVCAEGGVGSQKKESTGKLIIYEGTLNGPV